jgi:sirohydrochlorin cobaltochelatase
LTTPPAYFLVIHGSRNPTTQSAAFQLQQLITSKIISIVTQQDYLENSLTSSNSESINMFNSKTLLVEVAALELSPLTLNKSLVKFAQKVYSQGFERIKVIPLFLAPGVHVKEDIPLEIALAIEQIDNQVTIELSPFIGKYSGMVQLLADKFAELSAKTRILVAHGSRLPTVTDYYDNLADKLNATMAYWSTTPSLGQQVKQVTTGQKKIAILPYFLFPGKITKAIAMEVASLQTEHPDVELILGQPLGTTEALAELIAKEI